ncbi:hypothetical protein C8J56DRAFT_919477 [Mycena floridula]|nr:hypothetical protein C8J56DRAFT_919477 [Mycena floridula]
MMFSPVVFLALFSPLAARAAIHNIDVGAGGLTFTQEAISAAAGDQIIFTFKSKNHTVTQSSFAGPCTPKEGGFDSGFMPVPANQTDNFPTYTVTVNDTQPIWVFCRQAANTPASHCGAGMVFAANCGIDPAPNSFSNFKAAALAIGQSLAAAAASTSAAAGGYGGYGSGSGDATTTAATQAATSTSTSTSTAAPATHTVIVGFNNTLSFTPNEVAAAAGDIVLFQFVSKNHTVSQSAFATPCEPLTGGFSSGFKPVDNSTTDFPTWSLTVNDTTPIWAYCQQTNPTSHCAKAMVLAINAVDNGAKNFSAFQNNAKGVNGTTGASTGSNTDSGVISSASVNVAALSFVLAAVLASVL